MPRRRFVLAAAAAVAAPRAWTQARTPYRVGCLLSETQAAQASRLAALRTGLRQLGHAEGAGVTLEVRSAEGDYARLPALARKLVSLKLDVLVAFGSKAALAARGASSTIPIVVPVIGDPVPLGLSRDLRKPSANITGSAAFAAELTSKRIELLREALPRLSRLAALHNPFNATSKLVATPAVAEAAARSSELEVRFFAVGSRQDLAGAFAAMAEARAEALLVSTDTLFAANAREVAALAAARKLPSAGGREFADAGGLIGYGFDDTELYRRSAYFVDRLLRGARPQDLPIERPMRFELVLNARTARTLGLPLASSLRLRAERVIG